MSRVRVPKCTLLVFVGHPEAKLNSGSDCRTMSGIVRYLEESLLIRIPYENDSCGEYRPQLVVKRQVGAEGAVSHHVRTLPEYS